MGADGRAHRRRRARRVRGRRRARGHRQGAARPLRRSRRPVLFYAPYRSDPDRWTPCSRASRRRSPPRPRSRRANREHRARPRRSGSCSGPKCPSPACTSSVRVREPVDDPRRTSFGRRSRRSRRRTRRAPGSATSGSTRHAPCVGASAYICGLDLGPALRAPAPAVARASPRSRGRRRRAATSAVEDVERRASTRTRRTRPPSTSHSSRRRRAPRDERIVLAEAGGLAGDDDRLVAPDARERPGRGGLGEQERGAALRVAGGQQRRIAGEAEVVDDREHVVGEAVPVVARGGRVAVAVAAEVEREHVPTRGRRAAARSAPDRAVEPGRVREQDRRAVAAPVVDDERAGDGPRPGGPRARRLVGLRRDQYPRSGRRGSRAARRRGSDEVRRGTARAGSGTAWPATSTRGARGRGSARPRAGGRTEAAPGSRRRGPRPQGARSRSAAISADSSTSEPRPTLQKNDARLHRRERGRVHQPDRLGRLGDRGDDGVGPAEHRASSDVASTSSTSARSRPGPPNAGSPGCHPERLRPSATTVLMCPRPMSPSVQPESFAPVQRLVPFVAPLRGLDLAEALPVLQQPPDDELADTDRVAARVRRERDRRVLEPGRLQLAGARADGLDPPQPGRVTARTSYGQVDHDRDVDRSKAARCGVGQRGCLVAQVRCAGLAPGAAEVVGFVVALDEHLDPRVERLEGRDLLGQAVGRSVPLGG